jgi:transposase-like protein
MSEKSKPKRWTASRKTELVLQAMSGRKPVAELCREHGIAQSTFFAWKKAFLEAGTSALKGKGGDGRAAELERDLAKAQRKIGQLLMDKEILEEAVEICKKKGWS